MTFYPKPFTLLGCLFISSLEKSYFCILLLEIVAQWDYYYRIESTRKYIRSCSPTPTVSKAHNFFSRGDNLLNCVVLYTLECWLQDQVDRKSFHNVSNFAPKVNLPYSKSWVYFSSVFQGRKIGILKAFVSSTAVKNKVPY